MPKKSSRPVTTIARLAACLALVAAPTLAGQSVDESRQVAPDARIRIENLAGSVTVTGWNEDRVHVTGTLGDDVESLEIRGGGDSLSIEVKIPDRKGWGRRDHDVGARLEVHVPAGCRLAVETVSAEIEASGVRGALDLESVSGSIVAAGTSASAELSTVSGAIRFTGHGTAVEAESVSGGIQLDGVGGAVEADTVSGRIEVRAAALGRGDLESVSGEIELTGELAAGARLDIEGHSSNVTLRLPAATSARFDIETFSGRIDNDFGPQAERAQRHGPGKELEFTTGSGDAQVSIETFSGNVRVEKAG